MKAQLYKRDGLDVVKVAQAEAISWIRRVREDLREIEAILKFGGEPSLEHLEYLMTMGQDAGGAAAELQGILETTWEEKVKQS